MASTPDPTELSRDELVERVDELETEVETLRALAEQALEVASFAHDRLDDLEQGADGPSDAAREQMVPIHELAVDIQQGRAERIDGKSVRRAAELFRRMLHAVAADGEPTPGVDNSHGTVTIQSSDAADILVAFDDDLDRAPSATVKRAFEEAQRLSKREDCACDSIEHCGHGLVQLHTGATNTLAANTQRLIDYAEDVAGTIVEEGTPGDTGDGGEDADDGDRAPEAPADDVDARFDTLQDATPTDGDSANTVVSNSEASAFAAENGHHAGDSSE